MNDIHVVLETLHRLEREGLVIRYAIGGAVGATFYLEPVATLDVDVFVTLRPGPDRLLVSLAPLYNELVAHGGRVEAEHVVIGGWPVQFLPPTSPLVEEALEQAITMEVEALPVRVFTAEHLAAVALETGRAKDKARLLQFVESGILDAKRFQAILERHALEDKWRLFQRQFLGDEP